MNFIERQLEDPQRRARLKLWGYVILSLVVVGEIVLQLVTHDGHPYFWFESIPAWGSIYGFISCALIIIISKLIGVCYLSRDEDYYD